MSLLISCLLDLSQRGESKSPTLVVESAISLCCSISCSSHSSMRCGQVHAHEGSLCNVLLFFS